MLHSASSVQVLILLVLILTSLPGINGSRVFAVEACNVLKSEDTGNHVSLLLVPCPKVGNAVREEVNPLAIPDQVGYPVCFRMVKNCWLHCNFPASHDLTPT